MLRKPPSRTLSTKAALVTCAVAGLLAAACSGGSGGSGPSSARASASARAAADSWLTITPASGDKVAQPGQGITVTAAKGKLGHVSAQSGGVPVAGTMNSAGTQWHST